MTWVEFRKRRNYLDRWYIRMLRSVDSERDSDNIWKMYQYYRDKLEREYKDGVGVK